MFSDDYQYVDVASSPVVSIGLPVYNGENFLAPALVSLLNQTYADFEIIISDNGSTDKTRHICLSFASRDRRFRYYRSEKNLGAAKNFNHVVERARGQYFKWAAHDDICSPGYLQSCVAVLDSNPDVVCCHTVTQAIDEKGKVKGHYPIDKGFEGATSAQRFSELITTKHFCLPIFGLIRRDLLNQTPLLQGFVGSDRNLLAELGLMGKIQVVPRPLFQRRIHPGTSVSRFENNEAGWVTWFDPALAGTPVYPMTRTVAEYHNSIMRVSLSDGERRDCLEILRQWTTDGNDYQGRPVADLLAEEKAAREAVSAVALESSTR